jgi:hypothetical protein
MAVQVEVPELFKYKTKKKKRTRVSLCVWIRVTRTCVSRETHCKPS